MVCSLASDPGDRRMWFSLGVSGLNERALVVSPDSLLRGGECFPCRLPAAKCTLVVVVAVVDQLILPSPHVVLRRWRRGGEAGAKEGSESAPSNRAVRVRRTINRYVPIYLEYLAVYDGPIT